MAEYIEREVAVKVCADQYKECLRKNDWCGDTVAWNICFNIKAIPTADVVKVVRCKECKYYGDEHFCPLLSLADYADPNDFCSYGERKE